MIDQPCNRGTRGLQFAADDLFSQMQRQLLQRKDKLTRFAKRLFEGQQKLADFFLFDGEHFADLGAPLRFARLDTLLARERQQPLMLLAGKQLRGRHRVLG